MSVFTVKEFVQPNGHQIYQLVPPPPVRVGSTLDISINKSDNHLKYDYGQYNVLDNSWKQSPDDDASWSNFRIFTLNYTHISYASLTGIGKDGRSPIKRLFARQQFQVTQLVMVNVQFQVDPPVTVETVADALVVALRGSSLDKINDGKKGFVNLNATTVKFGTDKDAEVSYFGSNSNVQRILQEAFRDTITFTF